jgi:large subunit ribosomal protein L17
MVDFFLAQHFLVYCPPCFRCLQALGFIYDKQLVKLLFQGVNDRYGNRNGGYTRVKREPMLRRGDAAELAVIELVD